MQWLTWAGTDNFVAASSDVVSRGRGYTAPVSHSIFRGGAKGGECGSREPKLAEGHSPSDFGVRDNPGLLSVGEWR